MHTTNDTSTLWSLLLYINYLYHYSTYIIYINHLHHYSTIVEEATLLLLIETFRVFIEVTK